MVEEHHHHHHHHHCHHYHHHHHHTTTTTTTTITTTPPHHHHHHHHHHHTTTTTTTEDGTCVLMVHTINATMVAKTTIGGDVITSMTYSKRCEGRNINSLVCGMRSGNVRLVGWFSRVGFGAI